MQPSQPMNFEKALSELETYWSPRIIGQVNDQYIKVAKLKGEFTWHAHDDEDEMFLVIYGRLKIQLHDGEVNLKAGDAYVVPRGVMHNPVADEECGVVLIETVSTRHTGDVIDPHTRTIEQQRQGSK
ncbi:MAG: cupin domain-containing protein [Rhodanobacteraceae bacterium]